MSIVKYELKIDEESKIGSTAYTDSTFQKITVNNGSTNIQLDFGGVSTADSFYIESDQDISVYFESAGTEIPVKANRPLVLSGTALSEIYITNQSGENAQISWKIWGDSGASTTPAVSDLSTALANTSNVALGDAMIGYKAPKTGATARTVHARFTDFDLSVKDFGAAGDGVTNDSAAFAAAWTAIASGGGIYIPTGSYLVASGWDISTATSDYTHSWKIAGDGPQSSIIITTDANISLDTGGRNFLTLENLCIRDSGTTAKVGIARYRVPADAGFSNGAGHYHVYRNVRIDGKYSVANLYSIASEVNDHYSMSIWQFGNGAGFYMSQNNDLSLTAGQDFAESPDNSNTVSNWYGGLIVGWPGTSGGAVLFGPGISDNVNFHGTYLVGYTGGYNTKFQYHQGKVVFDKVRFEGTTHAIQQADDATGVGELWGLHVLDCTFGQDNGATPARDFYWSGTDSGQGLTNAYFDRNWHLDNSGAKGIYLNTVTGSYIRMPEYSYYDDSAVVIGGYVINSYIEAPTITLGATSQVTGSKLVTNSNADNVYVEEYGPNPAYHTAADTYGSAVVNNPFQIAPASPVAGMHVTAQYAWDPLDTYQTIAYPVFYDGRWRALVAQSCRKNSVNGFIYTPADTDEHTLQTLTIEAGTFRSNTGIQTIRINAAGLTLGNANTKTIKLKITDGTNTVIVAQNNVTTAPNGLPWHIVAEIGVAGLLSSGNWLYWSHLTFNGIASEVAANNLSDPGDIIDWTGDVDINLTGQSAVGTQYDISCAFLNWHEVTIN